MERGKDSRIIQLLSPSMRFLLFTISGLIAQAVVITELEESKRPQSPLSNPLRYVIALDVAPEDHTVSASEGLELTSFTPKEAALPESESEKASQEFIALDVAAEDPSPSASESEGMELATLPPNGAAAVDIQGSLEALRGFCAICQSNDMLLTHPEIGPCMHKFCQECFSDFESNARLGQALLCPVCRTLLSISQNDQYDESDEFDALVAIRRRILIKKMIFRTAISLCVFAISGVFHQIILSRHREAA